MAEQEELAERLQTAHNRWTTVRGTFRTWRHGELTTRAFRDWHHLDEPAGSRHSPAASTLVVTAVRTDGEANLESQVEHVLRVCAADNGRQRRAEAISRTGEEWLPDLVVVDEPWFWTRKGRVVQTNDGNPDSTHGGADFVLLLRPHAVPDGFDLSATGAIETVAGRPCDVVVATPKDGDAHEGRLPGAEFFDMISGGRDFRLCVDQETSTLMRITKLVGGEPAEIIEYLDITFDEPVSEGTFGPLA
ncbi:hypothetical protein P5P86_03915 [Nocardioides sp. BP30]|uniref:hypothetical protein n=1 Tax=Nocardioides sp. BP30 TaxID=3036374 RepID=UPI002468E379|nr:hypothetical protein [Nocardioides sp. BP30]WGL52973.1 hypothetical protein P5P86_03915 [Nocardioides sp. BP30]